MRHRRRVKEGQREEKWDGRGTRKGNGVKEEGQGTRRGKIGRSNRARGEEMELQEKRNG